MCFLVYLELGREQRMRLMDFLPVPGPILTSVGGNKAVPQGQVGNTALKFTVGLCGTEQVRNGGG